VKNQKITRMKAFDIRSVRVHGKASTLDTQSVSLEPLEATPKSDQVVVKIHAAAVNPSDVKAMLGLMPHAVFPRTPGRDWAGVVVSGASDLRGRRGLGFWRRLRHSPQRLACDASHCRSRRNVRQATQFVVA
jgi:NADPH:quinone reductase